MRLAAALLGLPLLATPPSFTVKDALKAEWNRQSPVFTDADRARLTPTDRARLELTLARIGAPGAPSLLPPELDKPTPEAWEAKARKARTPQERITALHFLNRLKSPSALLALEGLKPAEAATWPRHLHLEAGIATARLNGAEPSADLRAFLEALQKAGKIDPVRAQAARLRLVMGGKEKELLPPVKATPGSVLALMDAWNRGPWEQRKTAHLSLWKPEEWQTLHGEGLRGGGFERSFRNGPWSSLGLSRPAFSMLWKSNDPGALGQLENHRIFTSGIELGLWLRWLDGVAGKVDATELQSKRPHAEPASSPAWYGWLSALGQSTDAPGPDSALGPLLEAALAQAPANQKGLLIGPWRKVNPARALALRAELLQGSDPTARAAAIEDMAEAPADLEALVARLWKVEEYDGVQVLLTSLERWKLPEPQRKALLERFYGHPCWTARLDALTQLRKLEPAAPWPTAPAPSAEDAAQLKLAEALATQGKPVRLRLTFEGRRRVTLRLDPVNAPLNVANLVRLARKGYFDGRRVPRVVPDFVVQMGSPLDTMDGGPGYTVRCENSLTWYGPGTVGMALSGKDTGGSQFFITTNATPHLTGRYTRLGEVEDPDRALPLLDDLELGARIERVEVLTPR